MTKKAITNRRTPEEIRQIVADIDNEVPDGQEFVDLMENEKTAKEMEDHPEPEESTDEIEIEETEEEVEESEELEEFNITEDEEEQEEVPQKQKLPPIEQRLKESGQEAMILNSKNKKILETIEEAENLPEPTQEELEIYAKEMGTDFGDLDTFAQNVLKENLQNKRRFGKISDLVAQEREVSKWVDNVKEFLSAEDINEKYPSLLNKEDEFIKYASKRTHIGSDLDLLVAGFMWKQPSKSKKSVLLPVGRGKPVGSLPKKSKALTEEDAKVIRSKDHKKYKEMIKAKKFKTSF